MGMNRLAEIAGCPDGAAACRPTCRWPWCKTPPRREQRVLVIDARARSARRRRRRASARRRSWRSARWFGCVRHCCRSRSPGGRRDDTHDAPRHLPASDLPPGLMIAAPRSGSGKTTLTLGLLRALRRAGVAVGSAKCGPDYIDPPFHTRRHRPAQRQPRLLGDAAGPDREPGCAGRRPAAT